MKISGSLTTVNPSSGDPNAGFCDPNALSATGEVETFDLSDAEIAEIKAEPAPQRF